MNLFVGPPSMLGGVGVVTFSFSSFGLMSGHHVGMHVRDDEIHSAIVNFRCPDFSIVHFRRADSQVDVVQSIFIDIRYCDSRAVIVVVCYVVVRGIGKSVVMERDPALLQPIRKVERMTLLVSRWSRGPEKERKEQTEAT